VAEQPTFFEGTEKKVELVIDPELPSLRQRGESFWRDIVVRARAEVLSCVSGSRCDAYLLSESSLFVFDHKMIMITCGRTTLPEAVLALLETVPPERVRLMIYERKNEIYPHRQPTCFFDDVRRLREPLPGTAWQLGHEDEHHLYLYHLDRCYEDDPDDATVEVLMYGLDDEVRTHFRTGDAKDTEAVRRRTGLDRVLPGFQVDDHLFQPGGYSLNAIRDDVYYTIHVTPEDVSSYASFETNQRFDSRDALAATVRQVLDAFRPRSWDLVVFDRRGDRSIESNGYHLHSRVSQSLNCGYRVRFMNFHRPDEREVPAIELPVP